LDGLIDLLLFLRLLQRTKLLLRPQRGLPLAKLSLAQLTHRARAGKRSLKALNTQTSAILARLLTHLLLTSKVLLRLIKRSHVPTGADITHLRAQIALALSLNDGLTRPTESTCTGSLRLVSHALHLRRTLSFPKLRLHRRFNERIHVLSSAPRSKLPHAVRVVLSTQRAKRSSASHLTANLTKRRRA
jgi:hypothetical protein